MTATEGVQMPASRDPDNVYTFFFHHLDIPDHTYDKIVNIHGTGERGRREVFSEFLSHHPYPRWEVVVQLLERLEHEGQARAGLAQEVKEKYMTSE